MAFRPNAAARSGIMDDGINHFNGATITIFTGTQPGEGGGSHSDTTLSSGTLPSPAFGAATAGAAGPATSWSLSISATGTAGWARITQGSAILDLDVGTTGADLNLDTLSLEDGGSVAVSGGSITLPGNDA